MSIPSIARTNFQTLLRAAGDGNLALMECPFIHRHSPMSESDG